MIVGDVCSRSVTTVEAEESIRDAAHRMVDHSVGSVVVVDPRSDPVRPIGIVTDRDIVTRAVAPRLNLDGVDLSMIMSVPVQSVVEDAPLEDALELMSRRSIRRLVVVDHSGALVGIVALDDVLEALVDEVGAIGRLLQKRPPIYG